MVRFEAEELPLLSVAARTAPRRGYERARARPAGSDGSAVARAVITVRLCGLRGGD